MNDQVVTGGAHIGPKWSRRKTDLASFDAVRNIEDVAASIDRGVALAAGAGASNKKKVEKEGVFVLTNGVAFFRPVKTGITGTTDIEILEGLAENDQIVTGPYQVLRTLKDNTRIKIEKAP